VAIDGSHLSRTASLWLVAQEPEIGRVTFSRTLKVRPGTVCVQSFPLPSPILLEIAGNTFLAGAGDSIHLTFDGQNKKYLIDGGRYPGNYRLYPALQAMKYPTGQYRKDADNYEEYVWAVDSVTAQAIGLVRTEWERGSLTSDVRDYLLTYIKYRHVATLLATRSQTLRTLLPATNSRIYPTLASADFHHDEYAAMMVYIFCTIRYMRFLTVPRNADWVANYAVDSLSGVTRQKVLYSLIVTNAMQPTDVNTAAFTALFEKIRQLNLPAQYTADMERHYQKVMLENRPVYSTLLTQHSLRQPDGRALCLQDILDSYKGQRLAIRFRDNGAEMNVAGSMPAQAETTVPPCKLITVDLNTTFHRWAKDCRKKGIVTDEYYLHGGLKNPLASFLLIHQLPTYVLFNENRTIENPDLPLPDIIRNRLVAVNQVK